MNQKLHECFCAEIFIYLLITAVNQFKYSCMPSNQVLINIINAPTVL